MALDYFELDARTRELMVEELELDISRDKLYRGKRLTEAGYDQWSAALRTAFQTEPMAASKNG